MDKQYIEEITIANAAMNYPGIDVSAVRDYMKGGTPKIVTVRCLCTDCVYNKKARCAKPGGIMIQRYVLGPMCEGFKEIYNEIHDEAVNSLGYEVQATTTRINEYMQIKIDDAPTVIPEEEGET